MVSFDRSRRDWRGLAGRVAALLFTLFLATAASNGSAAAQSLDPKHPTPLGPGTNRGTIDNNVRGHFYTFEAGPGHIDVDMAFKEMGVFGNPYRQAMSFDFYKEDGTLSAHNTVVSQGAIAHGHTDGDLDHRQRFILAVTAQRGLIRLGGYYEVEIKGAIFAGPTVGAGVVPHDSESLVKSSGPLVKPLNGQ